MDYVESALTMIWTGIAIKILKFGWPVVEPILQNLFCYNSTVVKLRLVLMHNLRHKMSVHICTNKMRRLFYLGNVSVVKFSCRKYVTSGKCHWWNKLRHRLLGAEKESFECLIKPCWTWQINFPSNRYRRRKEQKKEVEDCILPKETPNDIKMVHFSISSISAHGPCSRSFLGGNLPRCPPKL